MSKTAWSTPAALDQKIAGHAIETEDDVSDTNPNDPPAVLSPGDSDAPDAPDPDTVYPDEQGAPGESEE